MGQINSRFNGKTGFSDQFTAVARFQIIEMRAVSMHLLPDAMTGAVQIIVSIPFFSNVITSSLVCLPAESCFPFAAIAGDELKSAPLRPLHNVEYFLLLGRNRFPYVSHPGDIAIDRAWFL